MALQVLERVRHRLKDLNPMQVKSTAQVIALGDIPVTITLGWHKSYVPHPQNSFLAEFSGYAFPGPFRAKIEWGNGTELNVPNFVGKALPATIMSDFYAEGTYTITVTITDNVNGSTGSAQDTVSIAAPVTATLNANRTIGPAPLAVIFSADIAGGFPDGAYYDVSLDYGDGSTPTIGRFIAGSSNFPSHTYIQPGTYTATLTVTDSLGTGMSAQMVSTQVTISVGSEPLPPCHPVMVNAYQRAKQLGLANVQKAIETAAVQRGCQL